ncbi:MAG TPA: iron-sulfur cluster insertion protein ErpA [Ktedonobacterales bacterium]|jgi:iron-sulfur cluster assembly protein
MIDQEKQLATEEDYFDSLLACAPTDTAAQTATETTLVALSLTAAEKVRALLEQESDPGLGLRVFVAGGGCSGLQYGMTLDEGQEGDTVIELEGVRVLVDEMSAQYIAGSEIDYVDSLMGAGFTVNNPNAVSTCGCGHSFKTAGDTGQARSCGCGY